MQKAFKPILVLALFLQCVIAGLGQRPEIHVSSGHAGDITAIAFSPDGSFLASGGEDNTVKLWDLKAKRDVRSFIGGAESIAFSPDGKSLASCNRGAITIWDTKDGAELLDIKISGECFVRYFDDGKTIGGVDGDHFKFWSAATGREIKSIKFGSNSGTVDVSLDGTTLAFAGRFAQSIEVFETSSGRRLASLPQIKDDFLQPVAVSPDGNLVVAPGNDGSIKVWDVASSSEVRSRKPASVWSLRFSPDGRFISNGNDLWDLITDRVTSIHDPYIRSFEFSPNSQAIAVSAGSHIRLIDLKSKTEIGRLYSIFSDTLATANFSSDGKSILTASRTGREDNGFVEGEGDQSAFLRSVSLTQPGEPVGSAVRLSPSDRIAFSPDGSRFAQLNRANELLLGDRRSQSPPVKLAIGEYAFERALAFSPDGTLLASARLDGDPESDQRTGSATVDIWEVASGKLLKSLKGRTVTFRRVPIRREATRRDQGSVAFSSDGKKCVATLALERGNFRRNDFDWHWDVQTGAEAPAINAAAGEIYYASVETTGRVLTGGRDGTVALWDGSTGNQLIALEGHASRVRSVAFGSRERIASGDENGTIKLWDISSGTELSTLAGHSAAIQSVAFSPDKSLLLSSSADGSIKLWDVDSGLNLATLVFFGKQDWVVLDRDGRFDGSTLGLEAVSYVQDNRAIPLASFYERFYTPKLLQSIFTRQARPLVAARGPNKRLVPPPLITISAPNSDNASEVARIIVEAQDQGGGVEDVRLYHNGKLLDAVGRQLVQTKRRNNLKAFDVELVPGVNSFRATAFNRERTEAVPAELKIDFPVPSPASDLYILAIGINNYQNSNYNLNYGRPDALAFSEALEFRGKGIFKQIKKTLILDEEATQVGIRKAIANIIRQAGPRDVFVFYYAGHGAMSEGSTGLSPNFYLVPNDVVSIFGSRSGLASKGISATELRDRFRQIRALKQLIVLDACGSGGALEAISMRGPAEEKAIMQLARSTGVAVLAAAGQTQDATEFKTLGHGVFTYSILKGLTGEADGSPKDRKITVKELEAYLNDQVPELTKRYRGKRQDPNSYTRGQDFPISAW